MSRVFTSDGTGTAVYVFSDDHCPPHVHARHRGEGWVARLSFSYLDSAVELMSIAPLKNTPLRQTLNRLLADIRARLPACRQTWWVTKRTTCLANQWAIVVTPERIEFSPEPGPEAKQIAGASYDPDQERLRLVFQDGTTAEVSTRP
jgi:hypothetical protein